MSELEAQRNKLKTSLTMLQAKEAAELVTKFEDIRKEKVEAWKKEEERRDAEQVRVFAAWDLEISKSTSATPPPSLDSGADVQMEEADRQGEADFRKMIKYDIKKAPVWTSLTEPQKDGLTFLWHKLIMWNAAGEVVLLYKELVENQVGIDCIANILGKEVWERFYGTRAIGPMDTVPNQMQYVLKAHLDAIASKLHTDAEKVKEAEEKAKKEFDDIEAGEEVSKRRRR